MTMQVSFGVSGKRLQGPLEYQNLQTLRYPVEKGVKSVFTDAHLPVTHAHPPLWINLKCHYKENAMKTAGLQDQQEQSLYMFRTGAHFSAECFLPPLVESTDTESKGSLCQ